MMRCVFFITQSVRTGWEETRITCTRSKLIFPTGAAPNGVYLKLGASRQKLSISPRAQSKHNCELPLQTFLFVSCCFCFFYCSNVSNGNVKTMRRCERGLTRRWKHIITWVCSLQRLAEAAQPDLACCNCFHFHSQLTQSSFHLQHTLYMKRNSPGLKYIYIYICSVLVGWHGDTAERQR